MSPASEEALQAFSGPARSFSKPYQAVQSTSHRSPFPLFRGKKGIPCQSRSLKRKRQRRPDFLRPGVLLQRLMRSARGVEEGHVVVRVERQQHGERVALRPGVRQRGGGLARADILVPLGCSMDYFYERKLEARRMRMVTVDSRWRKRILDLINTRLVEEAGIALRIYVQSRCYFWACYDPYIYHGNSETGTPRGSTGTDAARDDTINHEKITATADLRFRHR
nr:hypothetical protein CFP56_13255 [Quercus suber]